MDIRTNVEIFYWVWNEIRVERSCYGNKHPKMFSNIDKFEKEFEFISYKDILKWMFVKNI